MKRHIVAISMMLVCLCNMSAQTVEMRDCFKTMPDSLLPYLSANNRLDMIDFIDSGMEAKINNAFDEPCYLDTLSTDYLRLRLTGSSVMEMRLSKSPEILPDSSNYMIETRHSMGRRSKVETVERYTQKWQLIK